MIILWSNWFLLFVCTIALVLVTYYYFIHKMAIGKLMAFIMISILLTILLLSIFLLIKKFGYNSYTLTYLTLIYILLIITYHDIKEKTIPTDWLLLGVFIAILRMINNPNFDIIEGCLGAMGIGILLILISKITKQGIGMGDAYVFVFISMLIGWKMAGTIFMLAILFAGLLGLILFGVKRVSRKTTLPFMPFVFLATLLTVWM